MENFIDQLKNMLSYKRPAGSLTEKRYIERWIETIKGIQCDSFGNYFIKIGENPKNIFTSHLDTVHYQAGYQAIQIVGDRMMLKDQTPKHTCLGADDCAGNFLMMKLIEVQKPSLYYFFRAEEVGGLGSSWAVDNNSAMLSAYDSVISLDRKGTQDVISHQGSRTASDAFCDSLADELGPEWKRSDSGLFTDSANTVGICRENTNLSVGYFNQHSRFESLSIIHLMDLLKSLMDLNFDNLTIERNAGEKDYSAYTGWDYSGSKIYSPYQSTSHIFPSDNEVKIEKEKSYGTTYDKNSFNDLITVYPDVAERLLKDFGCTFSDLQDAIYLQTGELASGLYDEY